MEQAGALNTTTDHVQLQVFDHNNHCHLDMKKMLVVLSLYPVQPLLLVLKSLKSVTVLLIDS